MSLDQLTDEQCLKALQFAGRTLPVRTDNGTAAPIIVELQRIDFGDKSAVVAALVGSDLSHRPEAAKVARYALLTGLNSDDDRVSAAVEEAIRIAQEEPVEESVVGIFAIGAGTLVALAIIGKVSWKDGKLVVDSGLPGIKDAGTAVGNLISAALGTKKVG